MESMDRMIKAHPRGQVPEQLKNLLTALMECESSCVMCADACLSETDVKMLVDCIALNADCSDVCTATARLVGRIGHHHRPAMQRQLEACREICRLCAEECEQHEHEHCRVCAESCRRCEQACAAVLERAAAHA